MHRMVQGDVGCGKTAIAFGAIYFAFLQGFQSVLMAPTEILAVQHFETAKRQLEPLGLKVLLVTGGMQAAERRSSLAAIENGECSLVVGTHALLNPSIVYHKLGLAVTDEQHRFGVKQRKSLTKRGIDGLEPHVLVMSATPIPRSLALVLYGDLDLSIVNELPAGRIPIKTRLVPPEKRDDMYRFVLNAVQQGSQAYVVCPAVETEEEDSEIKCAKDMYTDLSGGILAPLSIGLVYGSMKSEEKNHVLSDFVSGKNQVLVSTTVIEVGINVPTANIMIIENANRFGLSQLHQLRGRVGRGSAESWCFLVGEPNERLKTLCSTNDGFVVAQKDLELRGPGEFLGTQQHGAGFLSSLACDSRLIAETQECVHQLAAGDEMKEEYEEVMKLAESTFSERLRHIALN